ncbi:MAG: hypothetical protein K2P80_08480 [Beijerinckiaceae bacterium]|nr:hypothetical protein [Beijerinckiaceae bacterium]
MTAMAFLVIVALAAIAIDVASFFYLKRNLQTSADLAAMAAASDVAQARPAAVASLVQNAYSGDTLKTIEIGTYTADASLPIGKRFVPSANGNGNAVRVTLETTAPVYFSSILFPSSAHAAGADPVPGAPAGSPANTTRIRATATATQPIYAAFSVGSRLVKLDGGLLNSLLGGLLGGNVSLTVMDYQSLVDAKIDLFQFSNALASRVSFTGVTYDSLASASFKVSDVFAAILDASRSDPNGNATAISALARIADTQKSASTLMKLDPLINFGPFGASKIGSTGLIGTSVSALDLVTTSAEIANSAHQIQMALGLSVPGISNAQLLLTIGERPQGTSWVAIGSKGASVHTAQTRLYVKFQLLGSGQVAAVNLPLYLELASATATLDAMTCKAGGKGQSSVTLGVTPALVDAWIGDVTAAQMANFTTAPTANSAQLVRLAGLASVSGRAHATMTNMQPAPVVFNETDIKLGTKKSTSTTDFVTSLLSKLIGDLQLKVNVIGLGIGLPSGLDAVTAKIIADAAPAIDTVLDQTLQTLGLALGQADSWVTGINCNRSVLVN